MLAAPVRANLALVQALPRLVPAAPAALPTQGFGRDKPIVLDLGSTKTAICQAYAGLPEHFDPVGGHPMGGKERGGLENADAAIFHGVTFALTALPRTSPRARTVAEGLARLLGSHPVWMEAQAHDRWAAATSHLPYLLANALALATPAEAAALVGPGFRSTSRLAAGFTPMMLDVLLSNRENVLEAIGRYRRELEALEAALRQGDEGALRESLERSAAAARAAGGGKYRKRGEGMRPNGRLRLRVRPGKPLQGSYKPHGDKSLAHRAALLAAVGQGESVIDNFLVAGVTQAMLRALSALGVAMELGDDRLIVRGLGIDGLTPPREAIDCGNSATTLRLLAGGLAAAGVRATLDGSPGLRRRPMGRIVEPLRLMGVPVTAQDNRAPLTLGAGHMPLQALTYRLPVASAQVKSCLLLAGMAAGGVTTLDEPGPSRDHTERMLRNLGFQVSSEILLSEGMQLYRTRLEPPRRLAIPAQLLKLPGDMSAAAFLIVAALITPGSDVRDPGCWLEPDAHRAGGGAASHGGRHPHRGGGRAARRAGGRPERAPLAFARHGSIGRDGGAHDRRVPGLCRGGGFCPGRYGRAPGGRAAPQGIGPHRGAVPGAARAGRRGGRDARRVHRARQGRVERRGGRGAQRPPAGDGAGDGRVGGERRRDWWTGQRRITSCSQIFLRCCKHWGSM